MKLPQLTLRDCSGWCLGAAIVGGVALAYDRYLLEKFGPSIMLSPQWTIPNFGPMCSLTAFLMAFYDSEDTLPSLESLTTVNLVLSVGFWSVVGGIIGCLIGWHRPRPTTGTA